MELLQRLQSRKVLLPAFGVALLVANAKLGLGLDDSTVWAVAGLIASGVAGVAYVDGVKASAATLEVTAPTQTDQLSDEAKALVVKLASRITGGTP